ncbi:MAG: acetyl-CoA hydrolase/transferase C-terminal domain-containing protein, partial [Clostridia bacterium]|nr:acetyl-CoA hydrolase/transferase C-terminal domain-containing protein [Clostridia bacterium]
MAIVDAITRRVSEGGETLRLGLIKTANANDRLESDWARYGIMKRRMIFYGNSEVRQLVNTDGGIDFQDPHLGLVPDKLRHGSLGRLDVALVSCAGVTEDGKLLPIFDQGYTPVALEMAEKVILEISTESPSELWRLHDVYMRKRLPKKRECISITDVMDRIGEPFYSVDPDKVVGIVISDTPMEVLSMWNAADPSPEIDAISNYFLSFLEGEIAEGRMPEPLPPVQTGAGAIADAVFAKMGERFSDMTMYTEGFMSGAVKLIKEGKLTKISSGGLSVTQEFAEELCAHIDEWRQKLVLRSAEVSNSGEVISRLGVIAMNNALEVDLYGNVNSTNAIGTRMISGIGGSGDYARNVFLTVFFTLSTAKDGEISS